MTLTLWEVLLIFLLAAYGVYLFQALRVRELALQAARRACEQEGVQLLDETVGIARISLSRDRRGHWRVWRHYRFEYSREGVERLPGHVIMLGTSLQALVVREPSVH